MRNLKLAKTAMVAKHSKSMVHRNSAQSRQHLLMTIPGLMPANKINQDKTGWFQDRKRANQRLRLMSRGALVIIENGYRGNAQRHWIRDVGCGHVFRASIKEIYLVGAKHACPFCNIPDDLGRFGSLAAIQEFVFLTSGGNAEFMPDNYLGGPDDDYGIACNIHGCINNVTWTDFIKTADTSHSCTYCRENRSTKD